MSSKSKARIKLAICIASLSAVAGVVSAQPAPEWISRLAAGTALTAGLQGMVVDAAGVSYVTGIGGPSSNTDIETAAYAPDGSLLWAHTYNGPEDWHDQARGITLGRDGTLYVTGNTPGPGRYSDVLVLAYEAATGSLLGEVRYASQPFLAEYGGAIAVDDAGGIYVAGGTVGDGGDGHVMKFDRQGDLVWRKTWDGPAFGPYSQDHADQILIAPDGNPVVRIHGVMNSLHPDYVVVKYSAEDGSVVWESTWGVNGGDFANDMEIDDLGDVYVTGTSIDFTDKFSTIKLAGSDGALLWQEYDSAGIDDSPAALTLDTAGDVYVVGWADPDGDRSNANDNLYAVKRDGLSGSFHWDFLYGANCVGCSDGAADVLVDRDGRVFIAGSTSSPPYSGDAILFVLDGDTGLEIERSLISGGPAEHAGAGALRFDDAFNLWIGGEAANFNTGEVDITVAKYRSWVTDLYRFTASDLVAGGELTLSIVDATPGAEQYVALGTSGLGAHPVAHLGVTLDLAAPRLVGTAVAGDDGTAEVVLQIPPGTEGRLAWLQVAEAGRATPPIFDVVAGE